MSTTNGSFITDSNVYSIRVTIIFMCCPEKLSANPSKKTVYTSLYAVVNHYMPEDYIKNAFPLLNDFRSLLLCVLFTGEAILYVQSNSQSIDELLGQNTIHM